MFLLGRFAVVAVHELAHGLTMASFGRRIERAGLKLIAIFPYAFVDTSEAWFEPRRRRIAISAAGPVVGLLARRGVRAVRAAAARGRRARHLLQPRLRRLRRRLLQPQPVHRARRLPHPRRRAGRAGAAAAREGAARAAAAAAAAPRRTRRCSLRYSLWGLGWSVLAACFAIAHDAALREDLPRRVAPEAGRLRRHGHALGRVLPAGDLRPRQAAVAAAAGS